MLGRLKLTNTGPAPEMELVLAPRLNLLTGDNGLGKSFLLDAAWWALTRKWPAEINPKLTSGMMAKPSGAATGRIAFTVRSKTKSVDFESEFSRPEQAWKGKAGRPVSPGLVLYAQVDGSFAVWDPARNYWRKKGNIDVQDRVPAYVFSAGEVWNGLRDESESGRSLCNGLIADWAGWQKENGATFERLKVLIRELAPPGEGQIEPGALTRISLDDVRDIPTIRMPTGEDVPVVHASAGIRRILALAYLLVWSWQEHEAASRLLGQDTAEQVVFLIDEIEAHLHPKWQRTILRALMRAVDKLAAPASVQLITATHSPLILASAEPDFNPASDKWFDLDYVGHPPRVELREREFHRRGDASEWLMSEAFDMRSARSLDAEKVIEHASAALIEPDFDADRARKLDAELRQVLARQIHFGHAGATSRRGGAGFRDSGGTAAGTAGLRREGPPAGTRPLGQRRKAYGRAGELLDGMPRRSLSALWRNLRILRDPLRAGDGHRFSRPFRALVAAAEASLRVEQLPIGLPGGEHEEVGTSRPARPVRDRGWLVPPRACHGANLSVTRARPRDARRRSEDNR